MTRLAFSKLSAAHLTAAGALLYAFGFLIANYHFGQYQLVAGSILQQRYLAAAAMFLAFQAFPMSTAFVILGESARVAGSLANEARASATSYVEPKDVWIARHSHGWSVFFGLAGQSVLISQFLVADAPIDALWGAMSFVGFTGAHLLLFRAGFPATVGPPKDVARVPGIQWSLGVAGALYAVLFLLVPFTTMVYPIIHPSVGGGAAWIASIELAPGESTLQRTHSGAPFSGVVIQDDGRVMSVLICAESGGDFDRIRFPSEYVREIRLDRVIPMYRTRLPDKLCGN